MTFLARKGKLKFLFRIKRPTQFIFDQLADMQKLVSVHPVITRIDKTGMNTYRVHEALRLGPVPISFTYPATVDVNTANYRVTIRINLWSLIDIDMEFVLLTNGEITVVKEYLKIKSVLPIYFLLKRVLKKQHRQLFKNIERKAFMNFSENDLPKTLPGFVQTLELK